MASVKVVSLKLGARKKDKILGILSVVPTHAQMELSMKMESVLFNNALSFQSSIQCKVFVYQKSVHRDTFLGLMDNASLVLASLNQTKLREIVLNQIAMLKV